ncbi:sedoheptulokinase-like [Centruroides vittatus]|uniref:sedoheptulokinase-like n=1 Tax=Centruroides vittatus TaxID=120091 RepID=UPI0035103280
MARSSLALGIDIGTTTVKVCLINIENGEKCESLSRETKARMPSDLGHLGSEQDVHKICTALQFCLSRLPKESLSRVAKIGISGQMHGCVLWKQDSAWKQNHFGRYEVDAVSCLYTWQDARCTSSFLALLPAPESHLRLSTGQGCPTLFWLSKNRPDVLEKYDRAGTIQDLVVTMLCGLDKPVMSVQNAASWGYFDTISVTWNIEILKDAGFPIDLLPDVVDAGQLAGQTTSCWYGIPQGTPVFAAWGDLQSSVVCSMANETDAVLNISTSAQLSFIKPEDFQPTLSQSSSAIEYFPYFNGRYLAVAASLNGGNVLAVFVRMLQQWTHELGLGVPESKIWERIQDTAIDDANAESEMVIVPTLFGERHLPEDRALVSHIDPLCLTLGKVSRALCKGVVRNLHSMMSKEELVEAGIERIVCNGMALIKNSVLRREVESHYSLPVEYKNDADAAYGTALATLKFCS